MLLKRCVFILCICLGLFPALSHSEMLPLDSPPENFSAVSGEIRAVPLTWSMHTNGKVRGYVIYRGRSSDGNFKEITKIPTRHITSYLDGKEATTSAFNILQKIIKQGLSDEKDYYYKIATITSDDTIGNFSDVIKVSTASRPSSPLNFKAYSNAAGVIALNWLPPNDKTVSGYRIYRKSNVDDQLLSIKKISGRLTLSHVDKGSSSEPLEDGHEYFYAISSLNLVDVESYITKIVSAKTKNIPSSIGGITASKGKIKIIEVHWKPIVTDQLDHYAILKERIDSPESKKEIKVPANKTTYLDENLPDGARYHYHLKAIDVDGLESKLSLVASGTTKSKPETPKNIKVSMSEDNKLIVKWNKNPEHDIAKYEVYKLTGFIGVMKKLGITKNPSFIDPDFKEGDKISYRIIAVDKDNLKSEKSEVISIRIPKGTE